MDSLACKVGEIPLSSMSAKEVEDSFECPVCCESFNLVENVPHILWCGHSLCKSCILSLQSAEIKLPVLSIQLPVLISCPWCQFLCLRLVWKGNLQFPRKNFFLLWLVESVTGNRTNCPTYTCGDCKFLQPSNTDLISQGGFLSPYVESLQEPPQGFLVAGQTVNLPGRWGVHESLNRSLPSSLVQLTIKFPVVLVMLILSYVTMGSILVLVVYLLITFLFAVPSFWILCFFHPRLERMARDFMA